MRDMEQHTLPPRTWSLKAQAEYDLIPKVVALDLGYARLSKGRFFSEAPNAPDPQDINFAYVLMMFSFR